MLPKSLLVLTLLLPATLSAQLVETIEVRVTNIDVVVTDAKGKPVAGLTRDDFAVVENGKEQPITNFYEIRGTVGAAPAPEAAPEVPPSVAKRRVVVFVDNYTIHPLARNQAFAALEKSMEQIIRPGDEGMIVFWNRRLEVVAPFSSDRAELVRRFRAAAKQSSGGMALETTRARIINHAAQMLADASAPSQNKISMPRAYNESIATARDFAEEVYAIESQMLADLSRMIGTLAGVEGKKGMIFLGAELPEQPGLEVFQQIDGMFSGHMRIDRPAFFREGGKRSLGADLRNVANQANANGVTMYMVDTANRGRRSDPTEGMIDATADFFTQTNTPIAMSTIAAITGGVSVAGGKSFEQALGTISDDLSSYYSIGYRSPDAGEGNRAVTVRVKRDGLRVRSRSTYVARSTEEDVRARVVANVFHANVTSDFVIRVEAGKPERQTDGQFRLPLKIHFPSSMTLIPQDGQLAGEFAVYIATGTDSGAVSEVTKKMQPMKFPAGSEKQILDMKTFTYEAALLIRGGEQFLSVAVVDTVAGSAGFAREKVSAR